MSMSTLRAVLIGGVSCLFAQIAPAAGISDGVYTAGLYAQIPLQDITDANRATYIADARAAGLETVILSIIDFCEEGEERRPQLDKLAREIKNFEGAGFPVMVWFNAFGYGYEIQSKGARNRFGKAQRLVGVEGQSNGAICPLDPAMRSWLKEMVIDCAKAGARVLLVDDDYVQSARGRLGCACPRHLAQVSRKLGRPVTREDVAASFTGRPNAVRSAFIDVNGEVAIDLAKELRAAVDGVDPTVGMGICLSYTHWDIEGVDMEGLLSALAGRTRRMVRISGAAYWHDGRFNGVGLEGVMEFVRMQSEWTRGRGWTVFDENDPYPRKVAKVPAWRCELYDKAVIADGLIARHKYMFCYGPDRREPGYLEAHLADLPDDARLRAMFAGTEPYGVRIDHPIRRVREATLPTPRVDERRLTELYSQPLAADVLLRNGIPVRHDAAENAFVFRPESFGIDVAAVDFAAYRPGTHRRQILESAAKALGHPLEVFVETTAPRIYQIVRFNPKTRSYSVLLENYGTQAAVVKIVVAFPVRLQDSLRGTFKVVPGGVEIPSLPPHEFAAVRFAVDGTRP